MASRRELRFASLSEVLPEVERLLQGHVTVGNWSLAQICNHLAIGLRVTSRPAGSVPESTPEQSALRARFFAAGKFPEGRKVPSPALEPKADLNVADEVHELGKALARFEKATGPMPSHPLLGPLSHGEWVQFHCMHAAHHLGFAVPTTA